MKTHKRWITIMFVTFIGLMALLVLADLCLTLSLPLDKAVFSEELEEKIQTFLLSNDGNAVDVIISGDSRAERQLIPNVVKESIGLNAVNIATKSLDLVTLANGFRKYSILQKTDAFVIVSTSIFQVNDGAVGEGYTTPACIFNLTWTDQIKLFKKHLPYLIDKKIDYYYGYFTSHDRSGENRRKRFPEKGYVGIDRSVKLSKGKLDMDIQKVVHPWYRDFIFPGKKWEVFQKALREIAASGNIIVLFNPPACPAWLELSEDTFMDLAEQKFSRFLLQEAQKYDNVYFLDYYNRCGNRLTNDMFYDLQHLNRKGSKRFTKIVSQDMIDALSACERNVGRQDDPAAPGN